MSFPGGSQWLVPGSFPSVYPSDWSQVPSCWVLQWLVPVPGRGYPSPRWGTQSQVGVSLSLGTLQPGQDWGNPQPGLGYSTPSQDRTAERVLLRGGRHASCVNAGGLHCFDRWSTGWIHHFLIKESEYLLSRVSYVSLSFCLISLLLRASSSEIHLSYIFLQTQQRMAKSVLLDIYLEPH